MSALKFRKFERELWDNPVSLSLLVVNMAPLVFRALVCVCFVTPLNALVPTIVRRDRVLSMSMEDPDRAAPAPIQTKAPPRGLPKKILNKSPWHNKQEAIANKEKRISAKTVKRRELIGINQQMLRLSRISGQISSLSTVLYDSLIFTM